MEVSMDLNSKIQVLKTILEPNRIKILDYLFKSESCVCEMVNELEIKHSLLSHHLSTLVEIGFLSNQKKGRHSVYKIVNDKLDCVGKILELLKNSNSECN